MTFKMLLALATMALAIATVGQAKADDAANSLNSVDELNEFDPFAPNAEETLKAFDDAYEKQTGQPAFVEPFNPLDGMSLFGCYRQTCKVWIVVSKSSQHAQLYVDGNPAGSWLVSSGGAGHETPDFDQHPNGRIYDSYTSTKFPEGDYKGLGNMPYAVFISGGFALHGTPQGSWKRLGTRASHGCIRMHPDNAYRFNRMVRSAGVGNVWVTVQ